ncbi:MAG TPA: Rv3654c family TadE-like protein [Actinomycetes bacterium]
MRRPRGRSGPATGHERGSSTIWVLACVLLTAAASVVVLTSGFVTVDRARAASIADEAALAAARHAVQGPDQACAWARRVARASAATVSRCRVAVDDSVSVEVSVPLLGPLARLPPVTVRARAGPPTPR